MCKRRQLHKSSLSNSDISPATLFGMGNKRTVSGLFKRNAIVPVSRIIAAMLSALTFPATGTVSKPIPHTAL